jgi:hypothetical protein
MDGTAVAEIFDGYLPVCCWLEIIFWGMGAFVAGMGNKLQLLSLDGIWTRN